MDFYHENKQEVQAVETAFLAFQSVVFVVCVIAIPFTGGASAVAGAGFLASTETIEIGLMVAIIALELADSQMDWRNDPDNTPPYVLNINNAKRELLDIDLSQNLQELSIALGFDSTTEIDLTDEESLTELSTTLAEIESSTDLNLQGVIRQTQYMMGVSENTKFINRKRREIIQKNMTIFNNLKDFYRASDDNDQRFMINRYLFKKRITSNDTDVLVDKTINDIISDGTMYNIINYAKCFYFTKGTFVNSDDYFQDKYMEMFFKFRKNKPLDSDSPLHKFALKILGNDATYSEYKYYIIFPFYLIVFLSVISTIVFGIVFSIHSLTKKEDHDFMFHNDIKHPKYETSQNDFNVLTVPPPAYIQ